MKIQRVSTLNRQRIMTMMASRLTVVSSVDSVEETKRPLAVKNDISRFSDSMWLNVAQFYDSLSKHSPASSQEGFLLLEEEELREKNAALLIDSTEDEILAFIENFIAHYNEAIDFFQQDPHDLQERAAIAGHVVSSHNRLLSNMGFMTDPKYHLSLDAKKFVKTISRSPHHLKMLLHPETGILRKIHDTLKELLG